MPARISRFNGRKLAEYFPSAYRKLNKYHKSTIDEWTFVPVYSAYGMVERLDGYYAGENLAYYDLTKQKWFGT